MIKKYSLLALQKAMNHALALDESMPAKLSLLNGRVLKLVVTPLNFSFFMTFTDGELKLLEQSTAPIDTTIQSSPLGLIRLSLLPASKVRSLFNDQIIISGDVELGQQVKQLFDQIDIDWEGHLAQFTGDAIAYKLGSFIRDGLAIKQRVRESMNNNISEYLQEELGAFPPREEINDFFNDIDELALDVERLSAHINQLANRTE